jgi:hypothetical protein
MLQCPSCKSPKTRVTDTREQEDRTLRRRRCVACAHRWVTLEVARDSVETSKPQTVPQAMSTPLFDLESALETAVQDAVACLVESVKPGTPTDRVKVELAKWMVEDRRQWRIGIAEHAAKTGQEPTDPAVAQLANVLRLVSE